MKIINNSKKTITILSILAGIVYFASLIQSLVSVTDRVIEDVRSSYYEEQKDKNDSLSDRSSESFIVMLKSKDIKNYYPDSLYNQTTDKMVPVSMNEICVKINNTESPIWIKICYILLGILFFPLMYILVMIPILFYKIVVSLYKGEIFEYKNVKRIKQIGIYYLIFYIFRLVFIFTYYYRAKYNLNFANYDILLPGLSHDILLMGLIALIIANVMNRAIILKEEQELTI